MGGAIILLSLPVLFIVSFFRPIHRLINILRPTNLYDHRTGDHYRLVCYQGYDKHSAVIAEIKNMKTGYTVNAGDWYYSLKGEPKQIKPTLKLVV